MLDPIYLRGRAEVRRRLAETAPSKEVAANFLRLAAGYDEEAAAIEKHQITALDLDQRQPPPGTA